MLSYHNEPELKQATVADAKQHQLEDRFIQGTYWNAEKEKGCSMGCLVHCNNEQGEIYDLVSRSFGLPLQLVRLQEWVFENTEKDYAMAWTTRFTEAIPVGVDLSGVWPKVAVYICESVLQYTTDYPACTKAISRVIELYKNGGTNDEFADAAVAAADAAAYAAYAADAAYAAALGDKIIEILHSLEPDAAESTQSPVTARAVQTVKS